MVDIETLTSQLETGTPESRLEAAEQLARLGPEAAPAAVALVRAAGGEDEELCNWATAALEELGSPRPQQLGELLQLVALPHPDISYWAATLLGRLAPADASAIEGLSRAVAEHPWMPTRQRAAWALGKIGPSAASARETLEAAAHSEDPRLARLATEALAAVSSTP